jgi:hypothetical protein
MKTNLDQLLEEGYRYMGQEIAPNCKLYGKGDERAIYDPSWDRVMLKYKVEEKNVKS